MSRVSLVRLDECASTNSELSRMTEAPSGTLVITDSQTAGRGQRGNSWESAPGENLTFSLLLRPSQISAGKQFEMSMCVSLGIADVLCELLRDTGVRVSVKWPNDIYADDRKICGILIENSLCGRRIDRSIVGAGININQCEFLSDAPNPVSVAMLTGRRLPLEGLAEAFGTAILNRVEGYDSGEDCENLRLEYLSRMWRRDGGYHPFRDSASGEAFEALIADVSPDGTLVLCDRTGNERRYLFKEVAFGH